MLWVGCFLNKVNRKMTENSMGSVVLVRREGAVIHATLNRPETLNALSLEVIRLLAAGLKEWEADPSIRAVTIAGAGDRAFCAGGDVKAVYAHGMEVRRGHGNMEEGDVSALDVYFGEEYLLNRQIFHYKKPIFAILNGIVMGGGFGVAGPCRYRIATDATVFAMPEVGIGLFPDVGSMWALNRAPGQIGAFLSVTGEKIGPADALYGGFATHYVSQMDHLKIILDASDDTVLQDVLSGRYTKPPAKGILELNRFVIDRCFVFDMVEEIMTALENSGDSWALQVRKVMGTKSPLSMKISLAHLRRTKTMSFDEILEQDYVLVQHFMRRGEFFEGVRAAVIDKDRRPRWNPARLGDVSDEMVESFFRPTGRDLDSMKTGAKAS